MKAQTIGTEIEFTGLTRQAAAETVAKFFGTTAIQLCCALVANAKKATRTLYKPIETDNAKFAMRTWLTRPQGLNLNGEEFATLRHHLTKHLDGNAAWRHAV